jgi:flagellar motility protein MotE (MotC chaperone)
MRTAIGAHRIQSGNALACEVAKLVAAGLLILLSATTAVAGSLSNQIIGAPVDRNARKLELHGNPQEVAPPIAYSFRIAVDDTKPEAGKKSEESDPDALPIPQSSAPPLSPAQQYCSNVVDATSAAQIAQQTKNLDRARKDIDDRISLLNAKAEVLKKWMKLREDFTSRATDSLVEIYSKMKPDSAAARLAAMDEMTSAAIIAKLLPKVSSPIMAEMDVDKAARLSAVIAGSGDIAIHPERKADAQH